MIPYIKSAMVLTLKDCYIDDDFRAICNYIWEHNGIFVATTGYMAVRIELKMTNDTIDYALEDAAYSCCCGDVVKTTNEALTNTDYDILTNFNKINTVIDKDSGLVDDALRVNPDFLATLMKIGPTIGILEPCVRVGAKRIEVWGENDYFIFKGVLMGIRHI